MLRQSLPPTSREQAKADPIATMDRKVDAKQGAVTASTSEPSRAPARPSS
jgi:hypothetical protein